MLNVSEAKRQLSERACEMNGRLIRGCAVLISASGLTLGLSACGGSTRSSGATSFSRGFIIASPNFYAYLELSGKGQAIGGSMIEIQGPGQSSDHKVHTWSYRITGRRSGNRLMVNIVSRNVAAAPWGENLLTLSGPDKLILPGNQVAIAGPYALFQQIESAVAPLLAAESEALAVRQSQ